jgi:hypothetical protein
MNTLEAISELKKISERSEIFKLDMWDRAHIDDIIKWLAELDKAFFEIQKLFEA